MTSTSLRSSSNTRQLGSATVRWTGRADGDARSTPFHDAPVAWLHQVHGATVHVVTEPGGVQGADGDALVTATPGVALAVFTADCAPVALASPEGIAGLAHAGWKGLEAGVIAATIAAMRHLGATSVDAVLGPCIRPECYEFGEHDLSRLADLFDDSVRARTSRGTPAFDLPAAVRVELARAGVDAVGDHGACTACSPTTESPGWFSHRARGEAERQATLVVAG